MFTLTLARLVSSVSRVLALQAALTRPTVHSGVRPPGVVPSSELLAVELCALLCPVVGSAAGTVLGVAQLVRPGRALAELPSVSWPAGWKRVSESLAQSVNKLREDRNHDSRVSKA